MGSPRLGCPRVRLRGSPPIAKQGGSSLSEVVRDASHDVRQSSAAPPPDPLPVHAGRGGHARGRPGSSRSGRSIIFPLASTGALRISSSSSPGQADTGRRGGPLGFGLRLGGDFATEHRGAVPTRCRTGVTLGTSCTWRHAHHPNSTHQQMAMKAQPTCRRNLTREHPRSSPCPSEPDRVERSPERNGE